MLDAKIPIQDHGILQVRSDAADDAWSGARATRIGADETSENGGVGGPAKCGNAQRVERDITDGRDRCRSVYQVQTGGDLIQLCAGSDEWIYRWVLINDVEA